MSGAAGQAAGLAVGAAVGSLVPGVGTLAGAAIGGGIGGVYDSYSASGTQNKLDRATIQLNQAQFHAKAATQSAVHAENFRQALATQVSLSTMRGGSGSLATQFGSQAYRTFVEDQKAIEAGVKVADVQAELGLADATGRKESTRLAAVGRAISSFDGINLNAPRSKKNGY
jgi:hypothetical protein